MANTHECPTCHGDGFAIGALGNLVWFRCRNCGTEYSVKEHVDTVQHLLPAPESAVLH